jgi:hypothetical protein
MKETKTKKPVVSLTIYSDTHETKNTYLRMHIFFTSFLLFANCRELV